METVFQKYIYMCVCASEPGEVFCIVSLETRAKQSGRVSLSKKNLTRRLLRLILPKKRTMPQKIESKDAAVKYRSKMSDI